MGLGFFKSRRSRHNPPALNAYGKLPITREFLQVAAFEGGAGEFKDWLDRCGDLMDSSWTGAKTRAIYSLGSAKEIAVASIWPSQDKGTGRRFPFSFYVTLPVEMASQTQDFPSTSCRETWDFFERSYTRAQALPDRSSFYSEFAERCVEVELPFSGGESSWPEKTASTRLSDWIGDLFPTLGSEGLVSAIWQIHAAIDQGDDSPIILPRIDDDDLVSADVWARVFGLVSGCDLPSRILAQGHEPFVSIWDKRPLRMEEASILLGTLRDGMAVRDLRRPEKPLDQPGFQRFLESFHQALGADATLEEFLKSSWITQPQ